MILLGSHIYDLLFIYINTPATDMRLVLPTASQTRSYHVARISVITRRTTRRSGYRSRNKKLQQLCITKFPCGEAQSYSQQCSCAKVRAAVLD